GGFHSFAVQRAGIFDFAVRRRFKDAARRLGPDEIRIVLGIVGALRFLFGVEVVKVAEEFIEAVLGRQIFIAVAEVVLPKLTGGVAERLERLRDGDGAVLQPAWRAGAVES